MRTLDPYIRQMTRTTPNSTCSILGPLGNIYSFTVDHTRPSTVGDVMPRLMPSKGDNFWGVDRSVDTMCLVGNRYPEIIGNNPPVPLPDLIKKAIDCCIRSGADVQYLLVCFPPKKYDELIKCYLPTMAKLPYFHVNTSSGLTAVRKDQGLSDDEGYVLDCSTWTRIISPYCAGQYFCEKPSHNVRFVFNAPTSVSTTTTATTPLNSGNMPFKVTSAIDALIRSGVGKPITYSECECGKDKHNFATHSSWCPKNSEGQV